MNETSSFCGNTSDRLIEIPRAGWHSALTRLQSRQSSDFVQLLRESSLHILPDQSGGVPPRSPEASHD